MPPATHAYLNGTWIDAPSAALPVWDAGLVLGATISEQLRSFGGKLFELPRHLERLERSLALIDVPLPQPRGTLAEIATELLERNLAGLPAGTDLGLAILVTPGPYATMAAGAEPQPTLCMHTYPLPYRLWAGLYATGQPLVVTEVRQVPAACWPREIKCRSRMHYFLADREAARREPGARALLIETSGEVSETATANVLAWFANEGLVSPPRDLILPGISLAVTSELAAELGIPCRERVVTVDDIVHADEVWLTSTPYSLLPVNRINGRPIGSGRPGPLFARMLAAWSRRTGIDIAAQASRESGV
ncbi:MAG: aminotransferase class IV [Planctomycetaceae bacterium]|nr:aminotransferase class IV [Planctomycetaceae bacterium]